MRESYHEALSGVSADLVRMTELVQDAVARAEAQLQSTRCYLLAAVDVQVPGHLPDEARSALQAYAEAAREPNPRNDLLASNR